MTDNMDKALRQIENATTNLLKARETAMDEDHPVRRDHLSRAIEAADQARRAVLDAQWARRSEGF